MFEKTLTDVVKGIRASKRDTALYISQCIAEIKQEINSTDLYVKANALNKLTFLQSMGYSMSWASFASIEVMSSPRFAHKRIGYLSASQGFTQDTEVILLCTNLLQKELRVASGEGGMYEAGLAINCISNIVTEDLARDLLPELTSLLNHQQPYIRKKALLCLYKTFLKYPQGLRLTFDKIQQALQDSNPSVVSCAVNVVTELAEQNPKNYLPLAPAFFQLLVNSQNNWMLIKVVKLLGSLVPEEPRLARKLLEPLSKIVTSTQAKSLLYEAVYTITLCLPYCRKADGTMPTNMPQVIELCHTTLKGFVQEADQNLKYLGLVGFCSLLDSMPKALQGSDARPLILACLSDDDVTIRTRALDLLKGMASRKNLPELVGQLLQHVDLASGDYQRDLVIKIIDLCSGDKYNLLADFGWYLDVLLNLSHMGSLGDDLALKLEKQVTDVALRVLPVRGYAVEKSVTILLEKDHEKQILPQVLPAIAWIVGEYSDLIDAKKHQSLNNGSKGTYHALIKSLTATNNSQLLPTTTQAVFLQNAMKVFAAACQSQSETELIACLETLVHNLPVYMSSLDVEVQERSFTSHELLRNLSLMPSVSDGPPSIMHMDEEDSDDDINLLGMGTMDKATTPKSKTTPGSLGARCRSSSSLLNYLFKAEAMKPVSAKAQVKKRHAPIGLSQEYLDAAVDLSIFDSMMTETSQKPGLEQVSFTQQRLMSNTPAVESKPMMDLSGFGGSGSSDHQTTQASVTTSFQRSGMFEIGGESSGLNQTKSSQDPFYLDSSAIDSSNDLGTDSSYRFGTIQLLDSGDEGDEETDMKRKKKKKKAKKTSKSADTTLADMSIFSNPGPAAPVVSSIKNTPMSVMFDDDDEDDDRDNLLGILNNTSKRTPSGLAAVDLTTPLGEDEKMPERKHRVVPEKRNQNAHVQAEKQAKAKKKKKASKKGTKESPSSGGGVGDLLGFSGMTMSGETTSVAQPESTFVSLVSLGNSVATAFGSSDGNAISTAFDDLLGLSAPTLSLPSADPMIGMKTTKKSTLSISKIGSKKRPWMQAVLKVEKGEGSLNWSNVNVYYKVSGSASAASLSFRADNFSPRTLDNLSISWKGRSDSVLFGSISAGNSGEGSAGPFVLNQSDCEMELKGALSMSDGSVVPIKLSLPASLHLSPAEGLTQDGVMTDLSSASWTSSATKIELKETKTTKVMAVLKSFFRAAEVEPISGPLAGTLAANSSSGQKVRVLFKVKDSVVKVDIKSTHAGLCKSLASDLKRVIL